MGHALPRGSTVAHLIETDGPGGAERVFAYLVSRLAEEGFHNVVLLPADGEGWLAGQLPNAHVNVVHVPLLGAPIRRSMAAVTAALRKFRPAVVHSHEFTMAVLGGAACWHLHIPHVITMHGGRYYATRLYRRVATGLVARAAYQLVAVSRSFARHLGNDLWLAPAAIRVIPNGIPPVPRVAPTLRTELGLPQTAKLVVTVGNLYPVKGHSYLLHAAAALADDMRGNVHVIIAGRGAEEQRLGTLASALGIESRVHLLGLRDDVANILRSADVFALPSLSEALPLALLEAMRAALPIVATEVGEVPAVLESGRAGLLVAPGDASALADALNVLLTDPRQARDLARRAERVATEHYSIERMVESYLELYRTAQSG